MTKKDLARLTAKNTGYTVKDCLVAVDAMWDVVIDKLYEGEEIYVEGFGRLKVLERKAFECVDPSNPNTTRIIPSRRVAHFTPAPSFKDKLNDEIGKTAERTRKYRHN